MDLIRNERIRLFATYLNGIAIAVFAVGGLAPLFSMLYGTIPASLAGFVILVSVSCLRSRRHYIGPEA